MSLHKIMMAASVMLACSTAVCQNAIPVINSPALLEEGMKLHEEGKYREAIETYSKINSSDTNYVLSLYEQALSYKADSQFEKSLQLSEQALKIKQEYRQRPLLYSVYASNIEILKGVEHAVRIYDSALALYPDFNELHANKAISLIRADKYVEAERILQSSLLRDPFYHSYHYLNGLAAFYQGKPIEAMLSFSTYLLIAPNGQYKTKAIGMMANIAKNENNIVELVSARKSESSDAFLVLEQIIASKIALDKGYKTIISMDDIICRQMQVLMEKLEFNENDTDFYMQYYVPFYSSVFADGKFEPLIFRIFVGVEHEAIAAYTGKHKRELQLIVDRTVEYFTDIRNTRELKVVKRNNATYRYFKDNENLSSHGPMNGQSREGKWTYVYAGGNMRSEGKYNNKNERDGVWKYYHINGALDGIENFRDGKLNGHAEYYYENGNPLMGGNFVDGKREGKFTFYDIMGAISAEENYKSGMVQGVKYSYFPSGVLQLKEDFVDNKSHGQFFSFYPNGNREKEGTTQNGELFGPYKYYHENGSLAIEGTYTKGLQTGTWKHYHPNGKIKVLEMYVNGVLDGDYAAFHENGNPETSQHKLKKGKINGEVSFYDEDKKLISTIYFDNGIIKWAKQFDKSGRQIAFSEKKGKRFDLELFTPDGFKKSIKSYNDNGDRDGKEVTYYISGAIKEEMLYKAGQLEGRNTAYHPNGKKSFEIDFQSGQKHGYYTSYQLSGKKTQEGWYQNDVAQGLWNFYNNQGDLNSQTNYRDDKFQGLSIKYWPGNTKESETIYDNGVIQSVTQYDTTGKQINNVDFKSGSGKFTFVSVNGKKMTEGTFKYNEYDGKYTTYHPTGAIREIMYYNNGMLDSTYHSYFIDQKLSEEGRYSAGKKTGTWTNYTRDGKLYSTEEFLHGEYNGKTVYYHANGRKRLELDYKNSELHGLLNRFSENGTIMLQLKYKNGNLMSYSYVGGDNQSVSHVELPGSSGKIQAFYPNGNKSVTVEFRENLVHGEEVYYHENGQVASRNQKEFGRLKESENYFQDGKLESLYLYQNGELHGAFKEMHSNGTIKRDGYYYDGNFNGKITSYDTNSKVLQVSNYYYGQMLEVKK